MDGHTIFFSPQGGKLTVEEKLEGKTAALTQFGKALDILGIQSIRASSPQAKGRVERLWGTLQKRLPVDMRVAGIHDIQEANRFLIEYINRHNGHFAVEASDSESAFLPGPPPELMRFILCVRENRKTTGDSSITWGGRKYVIEEQDGKQKIFRRGTSISVLTLMDGNIAAQYEGEIFLMNEVIKNSKPDVTKITKDEKSPKKPCKPAADHPWRSFKIHPVVSRKFPATAA
jgi:hypothetical protein